MCDFHPDNRNCSEDGKWKVKIKNDKTEETKLIYCSRAMVEFFGPNILHIKEIVVTATKLGR